MKKQTFTHNNQTSAHQGSINKLPCPVIRSVSFQKLREGSLSSRNSAMNSNQSSTAKDQTKNKTNELFQKMLNSKLLPNEYVPGNKMSTAKNKIDIGANKQAYPFQNNQRNKENTKNNNIVSHVSKKEQQQLRECTFHPRTNTNQAPARTINQFVEHQMQFEKIKQDRIQRMREIIKQKRQQQNTFQPNHKSINKQKNNQYQKGQSGKLEKKSVHQRLFNQAKQRKIQEIQASCKQIYENKFEKQPKRLHTKQPSNCTQSESLKQQSLTNLSMPKLQGSQQLFLESRFNEKKQNTIDSHSRFQHESYSEYMEKIKRKSSQKNIKQIKKQGISLSSHSSKPKRAASIATINKNQQNKTTDPLQATKKKNQLLVIQKIFKQINSTLSKINIEKKNVRLVYLQMCSILKQLKFINKNAIMLNQLDQMAGFSPNLEARKLLAELWQLLQGQINGTIDLISLIKVIYAVLGCHNVKAIEYFLLQQFNSIKSQSSNFLHQQSTCQNLVLTQQDSKALKNKFETFYNNRLLLSESKQAISPQYSFHPHLSKNTQQMAEKYRMKVINDSEKYLDQNLFEYKVPQSGKITHIDLLLLDEKRRQLKIQAMRQQKQRQIQNEENQILNKYAQSRNKSLRTSIKDSMQNDLSARTKISNNSKFQQLYENSRSTSRRDRTSDQIQMQKWAKDLTFKPEIHKFRQDRQHGVQMVQDFDKAVFRMQQGKKNSKNFMKQKIAQSEQNQYKNIQSQSPILYLNVSMQGNQNVKVPVFYTDNLRSITEKVYIMLDMDNNQEAISKSELQLLLKGQVQPALQSIH